MGACLLFSVDNFHTWVHVYYLMLITFIHGCLAKTPILRASLHSSQSLSSTFKDLISLYRCTRYYIVASKLISDFIVQKQKILYSCINADLTL